MYLLPSSLVILCLLSILYICIAQNGFANLNRETVVTRGLRITDTSRNFSTFPEDSLSRLILYPQFQFTDTKHQSIYLVYATSSSISRTGECSENELVIGAWRPTANAIRRSPYTSVHNFQLERCSGETITRFVCCTFNTSQAVQNGDILGIMHGSRSSLLHEVRATPQLNALIGRQRDNTFQKVLEDSLTSQQDWFPLISFEPRIVSGLLSYNRLANLLTSFGLITFFSPITSSFTCRGEIEAFYLAGTPGERNSLLTIHQWRRPDPQSSPQMVDDAELPIESLNDIETTEYPNLYKISAPASRFQLEINDSLSISFSRESGKIFELNSVTLEDPFALTNAQILGGREGGVPNIALLSLQVSGDDCGGSILYDLDTLANRAVLLQNVMYAPFNDTPTSTGYVFIFPNLTFAENGSIFLWRFAARINSYLDFVETDIEYPLLQVWRTGDEGNYRLISSSDNSQEPILEEEALNVYRYDVNLTYEAGDVLAVYQPPENRARYSLAFVNSSHYMEPNIALEREVPSSEFFMKIGQSGFQEFRTNGLFVEPVMNILSTSMPNDTEPRATFRFSPQTFTTELPSTSFATSTTPPMIISTPQVVVVSGGTNVDTTAAIIAGSVAGGIVLIVLLIVIMFLLVGLIFSQQKNRNFVERENANRKNQASINGGLLSLNSHYSAEPSDLSGAYQTVNQGIYYEIPHTSALLKSPPSHPPSYSQCSGDIEAPSRSSFAMLSLPTTASSSHEKGLQLPHNMDSTARINEPISQAYEVPQGSYHTAQAYEVPTQSIDRDKKSDVNRTPPYPSLEKPHSAHMVGYEQQSAVDEDDDAIIYVPTEKQRKGLNSISNIYYTLRENQISSGYSAADCFEECEHYWAPASNSSSLYQQMSAKRYREIPRSYIKQTDYLGAGQFGTVYKGVCKGASNVKMQEVAIKILKDDVGEKETVRFLQEGAVNGQFHHPNVVKMLGMVTIGEPVMIVLEYLANGDLSKFLRMNRPKIKESSNLNQRLIGFCQHIAAGMDYLSSKGFVHRDLAARNILLTENEICKITDFGLSRDLEEDEYYISHGGLIPVKWTAPEALSYRKYSSASDVWSYGVVMYEIWSLGKRPFADFENAEVVRLVKAGHRMKPPPDCPREIYLLMMTCWHPKASSRPVFHDLLSQLCTLETKPLQLPKKVSDEEVKDLYADLQKIYTSLES